LRDPRKLGLWLLPSSTDTRLALFCLGRGRNTTTQGISSTRWRHTGTAWRRYLTVTESARSVELAFAALHPTAPRCRFPHPSIPLRLDVDVLILPASWCARVYVRAGALCCGCHTTGRCHGGSEAWHDADLFLFLGPYPARCSFGRLLSVPLRFRIPPCPGHSAL